METVLYTSDIDGIHNRINAVLHKKQETSSKSTINHDGNIDNIDNSIDYSDFGTMSAVEMRACEMDMFKYKQMLAQHEYERGFRKKASVLERELNSKTIVKECETMAEFAKAFNVGHSKWMRCAKKTKEKYIKEFVFRKHGIPIEKKSRKGGGTKKTRKSTFNVTSLNLNNCESGVEPNICIKTTGSAGKQPKEKKDKKKYKPKIEITEEITKELEKYLQNLNKDVYDNPENITYDHKNKRIEELAL